VALDAGRTPDPVPRLVPETDEERRRWAEAEARREPRRRLREPAD
jgi:acyl-CoA hydrolase